ncbi:MAG TPA: family 43 glycosylhydrolase [Vicinamibacterales bacterium]|nr:family 43 glycosylhydrolase [Vicinamibacterales bacterium]
MNIERRPPFVVSAAAVVAAALLPLAASPGGAREPEAVVWRLDNLERIGGHPVKRLGEPRVVETPAGPALEFDGQDDGLLLDVNPLAGLERFTVEALFEPAADGGAEQRFLHFEEAATGNRALMELRLWPGPSWCLDTFLRHESASLTLIDRAAAHRAGGWHAAALTFDGVTMAHYVDGVREGSGPVAFRALRAGRTSVGVRQNLVSWFKGRISEIRISPRVLPHDQLLRAPGPSSHGPSSSGATEWARGVEGQRKADLGDGSYLNPIMAGDHPDPSILRDGADYYMTFSSFDAYPGLVIWHSKDLVNWQPVGPALFKNVGSVWAPDLVKHGGRYYIYFPGVGSYRSNYVVWADNIAGPWSDPIDLKRGRIDPGHAVGPDGRRYLFLSAGYLVDLADDGLSVAGKERKIYDGWKYPEDWIVEGFAQEGPKILKRGDYYHMVLAEGGTAGPPTGHMVVSARSTSIEGPWENSPYNPIVRTRSGSERWWSKGHATLVEGPDRKWYMVYHAYEKGFQTLGRQTLLEPIEWTEDGWFRTAGSDPEKPIPSPGGAKVPHGFAFSDDFSKDRMGIQWSFYKGNDTDRGRYRYENGSLVLKAKGSSPSDCSPLWFVNGDHAYEMEVEIDADPGATAGLLLFYSSRLYAGLGYSATNFFMHSYGLDRQQAKPAAVGRTLHIRIRNDRHIVTMHYSVDGRAWIRYDRGMELSGYHHNVAYEFLSLRPALYAAGTGEVRFRNFRYRALP